MFPETTVVLSDEDIRHAIERLWWEQVELRQSHQQLVVSVSGGRARLSGVVTSHMLKFMAVRLAEHAPGVTGVEDEVMVDSDLAIAVAQAIADVGSPAKADESGVQIVVYKGVATLVGRVDSEAARTQTVDAARHVRGIEKVIDRLLIG